MKIPQINPNSSYLLDTVDSTNTYCKTHKIESGGWVLAEEQTHGRGRGNHDWKSLGKGNIFFSTRLDFAIEDFLNLNLLSLFTGYAVLETIIHFLPEKKNEISLKWPNDIYRNSKKIAGILLEADTYPERVDLIAGIGINLYCLHNTENTNGFATLYDSEIPSSLKFQIVHLLIQNLNKAILKLKSNDIMNEISRIENYSFLKNKEVRANIGGSIIVGRVIGLNESGFLKLQTPTGETILQDTGPDFTIL